MTPFVPFLQRLQTEITQLMRQHMDVSQERDDAVAARDAAALELRSSCLAHAACNVM